MPLHRSPATAPSSPRRAPGCRRPAWPALVAALVAGLLCLDAVSAQVRVPSNSRKDRKTEPARPAVPPPADDSPISGRTNDPANGTGGIVEFASEPLTLASLGMTIQVPVDARTQAEQIGDRVAARIVPDDGSYLIALSVRRSENPEVGPMEAMDASIEALQEQFGMRSVRGRGLDIEDKGLAAAAAELIERRPGLVISEAPAARFYIRVAAGTGDSITRGYTFLQARPNEFVILEMACATEQFDRIRPLYETVVATATFRDPETFLNDRAVAVRSGISMLNATTPVDLRRVMPREQIWSRLYQPGDTGLDADDTELGYRGVRFWEGRRGEVDPRKKPGQFRGVENDAGFLAEVKGRTLDSGNTVDFQARFFLAPDRRSEAWLTTTVVRDKDGKEIGRATETGARTGDEMQVVLDIPSAERSVVQPMIQGEGYVSALEVLLLPYLLAEQGIEGEFGFYVYRSNTESISLRRDRVDPADAPPGAWRIASRFGEADDQQTTLVGPDGQILATVFADGRRWEPATLTRLERLWRTKGLPVSSNDR